MLKFRGFKLKRTPYQPQRPLVDDDFEPVFEQKGVDMRIGLDITVLSEKQIVDRIIVVTGDTDCVPALKHARKAGLQVILIKLPGNHPARELVAHADLTRELAWPAE